MNADHTAERSERAGAAMLPPAVTRWRKPAARTEYHAPLAPPFKVAPRKTARVVVEPNVPEAHVEPLVIQAPPVPEEPAVAAFTLAPAFAEELGGAGELLVAEPLDMVEFGAMIEPLENGEPDTDPRVDEPLEFAEEIALAAEWEEAEAGLAPQGEIYDVILSAEDAEADPVFLAIEAAPPVSAQAAHPHQDLSERLERLSRRLREERPGDLLASLAAGDRVDHLLAGLLAGYFSTKE